MVDLKNDSLASGSVAPKPEVVTPLPPKSPPPPKPVVVDSVVVDPPAVYRLTFRSSNGHIRADINKELVRKLSIEWGDLLRVIPNYRWSTVDAIVDAVWDFERRSIRKMYTRTRKQILEGIGVLLTCGVLEKK